MNSFISTINKISIFQKELTINQNDIFKLTKFTYQKNINSFFKKINIIPIDTTPIYFDLYKFTGITYSTGTQSPEPASAYQDIRQYGDYHTYKFIYPIYAFPVLSNTNPEDYTNGATPWEFQISIAIIKIKYEFTNLSDLNINNTKIVSFLYNKDSSPVQNTKIILREEGLDLSEISIDFGDFYRWIKLEKGYYLEYYAIYPVFENKQLSLNTNLYIYNFKNNYYDEQKQIQFK